MPTEERLKALPLGVVLLSTHISPDATAYYAVYESTGLMYSALPRDSKGNVTARRPKGGFAKDHEQYKYRAR